MGSASCAADWHLPDSAPPSTPCACLITVSALSAFDDNYLWLLHVPEAGAIVVDPGDAGVVLAEVERGLELAAILITHHHADHTGGIVELQRRLGLPCFAPADPRIPGELRHVGNGEALRLDGWPASIEVIATPGHTRSHVSYFAGGHLFCGDTLFSLGCGRLFEGDAEQMHASLQRLAALPAETLVCCTHEYSAANARFAQTVDPDNRALRIRAEAIANARRAGRPSLPVSLASELACNPFLRVHRPEIRAAAEAWCGHALSAATEVFAALRRWKDEFR
ncbi:hydroxyacylglutathione hydrolase [Aquimonas voraii]|uniref:Hydroxyacylglutathione hydrolase n=1 Tax=Aquimonas voraii TaxID=265719 RepID=A0A1G6RX33_9GAMM|nr:hydroxyacylglutathione hydrolase [Aquimonas voraii]